MIVEINGLTMVSLLYAIIGHIQLRLRFRALRRRGVEIPSSAK